MARFTRHPKRHTASVIRSDTGKRCIRRGNRELLDPYRPEATFDPLLARLYYLPNSKSGLNARTKVGDPHPAKSCSHARFAADPLSRRPSMITLRRPRHPRYVRRSRHLSWRGEVSDARGTVLVPERQSSEYALKDEWSADENPTPAEGTGLNIRFFSPRYDNRFASDRGVTVSCRGVALGRRRFATISRTHVHQ